LGYSGDFLDFITPEILFLAAGVFLFITFLLVVMIYAKMSHKKRLFFGRQKINEQLNNWISEALIEEGGIVIKVPVWLEHYFKRKDHRSYIVDTLINVKKNISGAASENITAIYEQLGLKKESLDKLKSLQWHRKARGIYELCMMGQRDALPEITKYTNSGNETVRMEAQIATVGFKGFTGLQFLGSLTQPLNDWQQLKLLEQLEKLDIEEMPELTSWLDSPNNYVKLFALKLADIYHQLHAHDLVVNCLGSENEEIRAQAIKTLGRLADDRTPEILKGQYSSETTANKKIILQQLCDVGSEADLPFLMALLTDIDDGIKIEASRAIALCDNDGFKMLVQRAGDDPVLLSISKQIKYELKK
jgi:HEAT repeat protein